MKKKIKKIKENKEDILKKELAETRYQNSKKENENSRLRGVLNQILDLLDPNHAKHYDSMKYEEMPAEIMKLKSFKQFHEGAVHPLSDVVTNQREIIRWLINPDTAENSSELEALKKSMGIGMGNRF